MNQPSTNEYKSAYYSNLYLGFWSGYNVDVVVTAKAYYTAKCHKHIFTVMTGNHTYILRFSEGLTLKN